MVLVSPAKVLLAVHPPTEDDPEPVHIKVQRLCVFSRPATSSWDPTIAGVIDVWTRSGRPFKNKINMIDFLDLSKHLSFTDLPGAHASFPLLGSCC